MKDATLGQGIKILDLIAKKGTPCEQLQKLFASGLLADLLDANIEEIDRNAFRQLVGLKSFNEVYRLTVNYDQSVEEAIKAGKYDQVSDNVTSSNFPSQENGVKEVSIELVYFGRPVKTKEALRELDKIGLRPATLRELLVLGTKFLDLPMKEFFIVALGSVWQDPCGYRICPYLVRSSARALMSDWDGQRWNDSCHFAAVRK